MRACEHLHEARCVCRCPCDEYEACVDTRMDVQRSALTTNARLLKGTKLLLPMPNDEKLGPSENEGGSVGTSGAVASIEEPIAVGAGAANEDTTSAVDFPDTNHASFSRSLGSVSHDTRTENTAVEKVA